MEIHTHRFDMTDPFAQVKQRLAQARTVMKQLPPVQRRALLEAMQTQMQMQDAAPPPRSTEGPVAIASVPVCEWDGGRDVMPRTGTAPLPVIRPRRIRAKLPWWWPCSCWMNLLFCEGLEKAVAFRGLVDHLNVRFHHCCAS